MTDEWLEPARDLQEEQREALEGLLSLTKSAQAGGDWSTERVVSAVQAAHSAGLSPDHIAVEARMSINEVRSFLNLPLGRRGPDDWRICLSDQPEAPAAGSPDGK
ncbi:hypothetical protein [Georgenia thermotolerans]|uniref:Uncharacterized protein n=1 Tax=Georgenia thermotolerans TaxID=527326 RepID=A0A7J5UQM1_9MICO|nr:hypothetical protein [Georgenia thermotolerans]KAE8764607.1 hypothetical protein GB883_08020 [Georgenia thermotolerans]